MSTLERIVAVFEKHDRPVTLAMLEEELGLPYHTIKDTIYRELGSKFKRVARGKYVLLREATPKENGTTLTRSVTMANEDSLEAASKFLMDLKEATQLSWNDLSDKVFGRLPSGSTLSSMARKSGRISQRLVDHVLSVRDRYLEEAETQDDVKEDDQAEEHQEPQDVPPPTPVREPLPTPADGDPIIAALEAARQAMYSEIIRLERHISKVEQLIAAVTESRREV